jgi:hypothetical protein
MQIHHWNSVSKWNIRQVVEEQLIGQPVETQVASGKIMPQIL